MNTTSSSEIRTASPGRIEFIGNHTDYNGGAVLGVAINLGITADVKLLEGGRVRLSSPGMGPVYEGEMGHYERQEGELSWTNYPLGILSVLTEAGHPVQQGCAIRFSSDLPSGAGLSSSAAIELATLEAACQVNGIELDPTSKVLLAQKAENTFVGVPCGMLDQAVSCFGKRDHLVRIDCATTSIDTVPLAPGLHFWIFNTRHKHSLVDSMYAQRHGECRRALEILRRSDSSIEHLAHAPLDLLVNISEGTAERKRAEHVVREHLRVGQCVAALEAGDLATVGDLLFASHESSRTLFENSIPELDTFVDILKGFRNKGVIGARLTGGGFGGAVMALTTEEFTIQDADEVLAAYSARMPGHEDPDALHVVTGDGTRRLA